MKLIACFLILFISGCGKESPKPIAETNRPSLSLHDAAFSFRLGFRQSDVDRLDGFSYLTYLNRDNAAQTFTVTDSIRIENLWLVFYKYSFNGATFQYADWFVNIKGSYFYAGVYISEYNADKLFSSDNVDVVKALVKKADLWQSKSEQKWWKYID